MEANIESIENLRINLSEQGYDLDKVPLVFQYNKRDLPNVVPVDEMRKSLNPRNAPDFEAVASDGTGVFDTLKAIAKLVIMQLKKGQQG
jgi:signal recognition particle receptor subunit beta